MARNHVLIVDDDPNLRSFLVETLSASIEGCHVSAAGSAEEAVQTLRESRVDVLITDLWMPDITGLALIRWVDAFRPGVPAILMTGDRRRGIAAKARSCGAWCTIMKSLDLSALVQEAVRDALSA